MLELVLGGARSGKSALAVARAVASGRDVIFVATALPSDEEMRERIARHRRDRPSSWTTIEGPSQLAGKLAGAAPNAFVVVDCLTLWLAATLYPPSHTGDCGCDEEGWERERTALLDTLPNLRGDAVLVSNEVGLGLVPDSAVGRRFRDEQGRLNQQLAALCDRVTLVTAGLPLRLK